MDSIVSSFPKVFQSDVCCCFLSFHGSSLQAAEKSLICNVLDFFEKERIESWTSCLCTISCATNCVCLQSKRFYCEEFCRSSHSASASVADADVEETRGRWWIVVDEFARSVILRQVHSFFAHRKHPTVEKVFAHCKEEIPDLPDMGGKTTFWKILKSIGFQYVKTKGSTKLMMERNDIVAWRHRYLQQIREIRQAGRPLVSLDKT